MTDKIDAAMNDDQENGLTKLQNHVMQWQTPLAFGPFILMIITAQMPISDKLPHWLILPTIFATVFWAVALKGYALYLKYQSN